MLKKSLYIPLACALPLTTYAENLSVELYSPSQLEQIFPSKTYFLMAVDSEIKSNIRTNDIGRLLGVPEISKEDAETVFYGVRKSMLKYAATAWDAGIALEYGKDVGKMLGLSSVSLGETSNEKSLHNKILLFRYAQQYDSSKQVIEQYRRQLEPLLDSANSYQECVKVEPHTDYKFYQKLSSNLPESSLALPLALRYEALMPCQKLALSDYLEQSEKELNKVTFLQGIASVQVAN